VLDTANMHRYLRSFLRRAPGRPRLWGLHNYQDVNNRTSGDTRRMLETVPGEVWLTETNGIVKFGNSRQFSYSESRAARCTRWMFRLADRYDSRRRGLRSKLTRLYLYQWFGAPVGARFDAGLVDPDGTPRPAYFVLQRHARATARSRPSSVVSPPSGPTSTSARTRTTSRASCRPITSRDGMGRSGAPWRRYWRRERVAPDVRLDRRPGRHRLVRPNRVVLPVAVRPHARSTSGCRGRVADRQRDLVRARGMVACFGPSPQWAADVHHDHRNFRSD
jgi:hypothetical protein